MAGLQICSVVYACEAMFRVSKQVQVGFACFGLSKYEAAVLVSKWLAVKGRLGSGSLLISSHLALGLMSCIPSPRPPQPTHPKSTSPTCLQSILFPMHVYSDQASLGET